VNNALNLPEIDQEEALNLCKFFIRAGQNTFLFGRKGVGKSQISIQAIQQCQYKVNYINLSVVERNDLCGLPNVYDTGDVVSYKSPAFLPKLIAGNKPDTVILFDEVDKCPPEITAPLLEILQFNSINGNKLNVAACLLTGNLPEERTYSNLISSALLDRGSKYILSFNFDKWLEWGKINNIHDLILGFLRSHPDLACGKIEDSCYASPSPRSWTLASDALIRAKEMKVMGIETITHIISGFVGLEAGIKFKVWYQYYRKFEPFIHSLIETGTTNFDFAELTPTEKLVFVIAACYHTKLKLSEEIKSKKKFVYLENLCKFLQNYKVDNEVQVMGFFNAFSFEYITKNKLYECKLFFEHFNKLNEGISIKK